MNEARRPLTWMIRCRSGRLQVLRLQAIGELNVSLLALPSESLGGIARLGSLVLCPPRLTFCAGFEALAVAVVGVLAFKRWAVPAIRLP
jgi:hypothetical protein